jgi:hypothetical protein
MVLSDIANRVVKIVSCAAKKCFARHAGNGLLVFVEIRIAQCNPFFEKIIAHHGFVAYSLGEFLFGNGNAWQQPQRKNVCRRPQRRMEFVATVIELYLYACESVSLQQLHQKITGILPMLGRSVIFLTVGRIAWAERNSRRRCRNLFKARAKDLLDICSFLHAMPG